MISKIALKDIKFYSFHGVNPQETIVGNNYMLTVVLTVPLEKATQTDCLDDTINYAEVYGLIKKEMDIPSKLLEHAAGRILRSLKRHFPLLTRIELSLSKVNPPLGGDVFSASVILDETYD